MLKIAFYYPLTSAELQPRASLFTGVFSKAPSGELHVRQFSHICQQSTNLNIHCSLIL